MGIVKLGVFVAPVQSIDAQNETTFTVTTLEPVLNELVSKNTLVAESGNTIALAVVPDTEDHWDKLLKLPVSLYQ